MIQICEASQLGYREASQLAVENGAKAVAILAGAPAPRLWSHDIKQIADSIDGHAVKKTCSCCCAAHPNWSNTKATSPCGAPAAPIEPTPKA